MSGGSKPVKLSVEGLCKIFGNAPETALQALQSGATKDDILNETGQVVAVQDASFEVMRGEIFVVMGLSGSGKSTLVRMLNRLIEPTSGSVHIDGADVTAMSESELVALRRRDVAMVFQSFALMPHLSNLDNVAFGLDVAGVDKKERRERAMRTLETVGLSAYAENRPRELSGGMRQRVGLARALVVEPTILLMDEAFSALDPMIRLDMQDELIRIQRERDLTVVFISHDHDEALHIGDRLAIMKDGAIVQTGTAQEFVNNPANDYVRAFFGEVDLSKVFTAGDLAQIEPGTVIRDAPVHLRDAIRDMEQGNQSYAYVQNGQGKFEGVVTLEGLQKVRAQHKKAINEVFLPYPCTLNADMLLQDCLEAVVEASYPVPVLGEDGRFCGTISRKDILSALNRED